MSTIVEVHCPTCKVSLKVPTEAAAKKGRCRACGTVFSIGALLSGSESSILCEDSVLNWLSADIATEGRHAAPHPPAKVPLEAPAPSGKHFALRVARADTTGARLLFNAHLLYDQEFRLSFPTRCLICGDHEELTVHLVVWTRSLADALKARPPAAAAIPWDDLGHARGRDLLAMVGRMKNIVEPYCLPFPYFVCSLCSNDGLIASEVATSALGDQCSLTIASLSGAEQFVQNACGPDCEQAGQVRAARLADKDQPWRTLPLTVRMRLSQWAEMEEGERFLTYVPDASLSRAEQGLAGVTLTNRRLICFRTGRRIELSPFGVVSSMSPAGSNVQLDLAGAQGQSVRVLARAKGAQRLVHLLTLLSQPRSASA